MNISIKCYATLSDKNSCNFRAPVSVTLPHDARVKDAVEVLGIPEPAVKLTFVNSRSVGFDTPLADGDRLGIFPPVGGM